MQVFLTLGDIIGLAVLSIAVVATILISIIQRVQQSRCAHEFVNETSSCDAICRHCGKNLGFIGNWRKAHNTSAKDQS